MLTEKTALAGEFRSSGYREPPGLVARGDGQMVRLPQLLFLVAGLIDELRDEHADDADLLAAVADRATRESGLDLTAEHIEFLVDHKLAPLGVTTYSDGSSAVLGKTTPLLSLRVRLPLLPAWATWRLAGLFGWLFRPPVLIVAVVAAIAADVWVLAAHNPAEALRFTLQQPTSILLVLALAIVSTAFHEIGHATACRYSGARPGTIGCGIYLVWPAFYTDITDSYRLDRLGRLRTDLGGVYFNGLSLLVLVGAYLETGYPPLLVAVLAINLEVVQQLLPTLRFDGYYIVSDLVGVPDLFRFIGPILRRTVLRRPAEPQLSLLRRRPQLVVTAWVLMIVPALAAQLTYLAVQLPGLTREVWLTIDSLIRQAAAGGAALDFVSATVRALLLMLPVIGAVLIFAQLGRMAMGAVHRRLRGRVPHRVAIAGVAATAVLVGGLGPSMVPTTRPQAAGPPRTAPGTTETPAPPTTHGGQPEPPPTASRMQPSTTDIPTEPPRRLPAPARQVPAEPDNAAPPPDVRPTPPPEPAPAPPPPSSPGNECQLIGLPLPALLCLL